MRPLLESAGAALMILGWALTAQAQADGAREAALKAAFLYNFAKFTDWGAGRFRSPSDPIVFCIGVDSPMRDAVAELQGKLVETHPLRVVTVAGAANLTACHVLFVDASLPAGMRRQAVAAAGLLTVSDLPNFAQSGGDIGFYYEHDRLRFEINVASAQRAGITFSSRLLQLATVVGRQSKWPPAMPFDLFARLGANRLDKLV